MVVDRIFRRAALALATLAALAGTASTAGDLGGVGQAARPFTITTFAKQKVRLADLRGKVVVINYWATWCAPCKAEMPMMDAFHRRHRDEGFEIHAITTEGSVPQYQLRRLASLISFPLASKLAGSGYGTIGGAVPSSYVIDRAGTLRYAKSGAFERAEFETLILPLLREPVPAP
jgi:cytochrome c biogenesis protein CcmG/thiol:disulfide interchange protein DsbE